MKTFIEFSKEYRLTQTQRDLCFCAWNTAGENKNELMDKVVVMLEEGDVQLALDTLKKKYINGDNNETK